jgi:hypothetical protein
LSDGTTYTTVSGTTLNIAKTVLVGSGLSTTYTISNVTDQYGSGTTTGAATISTTVPVVITAQPVATQTINEGTTATMSVSATGDGIAAYQWFTEGGTLVGTTTNAATFTTTNTISAAGSYYVTVSGTCNVVTSSKSVVIVNARPQGSLSGNTIQTGTTGQLTYTSSNGAGTFTIEYLPAGGTVTSVTNVTSGVAFNVASATPASTLTYTLVSVTNEATTASRTTGFTNATGTITVFDKPTAALSGTPSICDKSTATLNVALTGNATASITVTLNDGTVKTFAAGTTSGTISVTPATNTTYTIASVTDQYGNGTSTGSATVTIYAPAAITVQPVSAAEYVLDHLQH